MLRNIHVCVTPITLQKYPQDILEVKYYANIANKPTSKMVLVHK